MKINPTYYDLALIDITLNNNETNWWDCLALEGQKIKSFFPFYRHKQCFEETLMRLHDQKVNAASVRDSLTCAVCLDSINPLQLKTLVCLKIQRDEFKQKNISMQAIIQDDDHRHKALESEINRLAKVSQLHDLERKKELDFIKGLISSTITNSKNQSSLLEQAIKKIDDNNSREMVVRLLQEVLEINKKVNSDIGLAVDLCQEENKYADIKTALKFAADQVVKNYKQQLVFDFKHIPNTMVSGSQLLLNELLAKLYLRYFHECKKNEKAIDIHVNNAFQEHAILIFSLATDTEIFFVDDPVFFQYLERFKSYDSKSTFDQKANIQKVTFFIKK